MDGRPTLTDCDEAGDYVVPNVLSPRDLVFRPDNMDETVPHTQISFAVTFVFVTRKVQSIYSKFQVYSHLLWLRSPVCVGPGRKPQRPVFLTMRLIARWVSDQVGNPKDRFSHNEVI